jgi:hypothetical protein
MSLKSRVKKLEANAHSNTPAKVIKTWDDMLAANHVTWALTAKEIEQLDPYKQKFEAGTWTIKDDLYPMMDILY